MALIHNIIFIIKGKGYHTLSKSNNIVYVNHFSLNRETVSLICSMRLCVMVIPLYRQHPPPPPYMVCGDPESGTDQSLKEVSAYIIWYRVHTWGLQGKCHKFFFLGSSGVFFTNNIHISVKNSSAQGTCSNVKGSIFLGGDHGATQTNKQLICDSWGVSKLLSMGTENRNFT